MSPLISIIVPVFNAEKTLMRCLNSILAQDYTNYQVVLVDDGSVDNSGAICDAYANQDSRIQVLHQENHGVSYARNAGMSIAAGAYLYFLDSDDWISPETLSVYVQALHKYDGDVVVGGLTVHEDGSLSRVDCETEEQCFGADLWETMCLDSRRFGYAGGKLIRRSVVNQNALSFNENMSSQEDMDFLLSVYEHCSRVCVIPFTGYQYDYVPGKRNPPVWDFIANQIKLLCIARKKMDISAHAQDRVHRRIASLLFSGLYDAAERRDFDDVVRRIAGVSGLAETLKSSKVKGEHGLVARSFAAENYQGLYRYFKLRNAVRDLVRVFMRKTKR